MWQVDYDCLDRSTCQWPEMEGKGPGKKYTDKRACAGNIGDKCQRCLHGKCNWRQWAWSNSWWAGCGDNNKMYIIHLILLGHDNEPIQDYSLATETKQ